VIHDLQSERDRRAEEAFQEYVALATKAQTTLSAADAREAGKAWGRYMKLYEDRPVAAAVIEFRGAQRARS
jgi:hypothetical protein